MDAEAVEGQEYAKVDARAAGRMSLFVSATLTLETGESMPVTVRNISATGMMAQVPMALMESQTVSISLTGLGSLDASIVWQARSARRLRVERADRSTKRATRSFNPDADLATTSRDPRPARLTRRRTRPVAEFRHHLMTQIAPFRGR